jgi:dCMP deaminase
MRPSRCDGVAFGRGIMSPQFQLTPWDLADLDRRCVSQGAGSPPTLEEFVKQSDVQLFSPESGLEKVMHKAQLRLLNSNESLEDLYASLDALDIPNPSRLRPSWDQYFMELASLAAQRSNCMKRRVGCVLVREKRVISTGYNGTPRGIRNCNEGGCKSSVMAKSYYHMLIKSGPRCNGGGRGGSGLETCLCIHAEENALIEAGRERIREGAILYCDT